MSTAWLRFGLVHCRTSFFSVVDKMLLDAMTKFAAVRSVTADDSQKLIDLGNRLANEAAYLLVSPVDPVGGSALIKASLENEAGSPLSRIFVAEVNDVLVGIVLCREHFHPAQRGIVQIDLGVDAAHRSRGIGRSLLQRAVQWAGTAKAHRMQLTVITANAPALPLYRHAGFKIEGTLKRAAQIEGEFYDAYLMAKLLPDQSSDR